MAGALSMRSSTPVTKLWAGAILPSLGADQQGRMRFLLWKVTLISRKLPEHGQVLCKKVSREY